MVGDGNGAGNILLAGLSFWENCCQQVIRAHTLDGRGNFLPVSKADQGQRTSGVPTPARCEQWRRERRLFQHFPRRRRMEEMKNVRQGEAVLLGERNIQPIVCRRSLQLEIEGTTEALSQRQSPGLVDSSAERGMNYKLHAAALIEEAFSDNGVLRGHGPHPRAPGHDILDPRLGPRIVKSAFPL